MTDADTAAAQPLGPTQDIVLPGGLVVRVQGALGSHRSALERTVGRLAVADPDRIVSDLQIRFVEGLTPAGTLRLIGEDAGVDADGTFYVVRMDGDRRRLVAVSLDPREPIIACDAALTNVPHLVPILNAIAVTRGILPLHAAAAVVHGIGLAVAGWSKGGKTEALLAMHAAGGIPIADEWCYVDPSSRIGHGLPGPIRLTAEHMRQLAQLAQLDRRASNLRVHLAGRAARAYGSVNPRTWRRLRGLSWIHRLMPLVEERSGFEADVAQAFGGPYAAQRLDRVVMVAASERRETIVRRLDATEAVERMVAAHMHHRMGLQALGQQHGFALPGIATILDDLEGHERDLLRATIGDGPVALIDHPHPAPIAELQEAILSIVHDASGS